MKKIYKKQTISFILFSIMVLALVNSGYFFLSVMHLRISEWLAFNACSFAIIVYIAGFSGYQFTGRHELLAIPLLPMYYYGTMGLFLMPWNAGTMFAQITHIIITINVIWIVFILVRERRYESLGRGALWSIVLFVPVFAIIQTYNQLHMDEFRQLLQNL